MYSVSDDSPSLLWFSVCYQCSRKKFQTRRLSPRRVMKGFLELGPVQGARTSCLPRPLALSDGVSVFFVLSKSCSGWHEEAFDMFKCKVWWGSPTTFKKSGTLRLVEMFLAPKQPLEFAAEHYKYCQNRPTDWLVKWDGTFMFWNVLLNV